MFDRISYGTPLVPPPTCNIVLLTLEFLLNKHDSDGAMGGTFQETLLEVKQKGRMTLEKLILISAKNFIYY